MQSAVFSGLWPMHFLWDINILSKEATENHMVETCENKENESPFPHAEFVSVPYGVSTLPCEGSLWHLQEEEAPNHVASLAIMKISSWTSTDVQAQIHSIQIFPNKA